MSEPDELRDASDFHVAAGLIFLVFFLLVVIVVGAWTVNQIWSPTAIHGIPKGAERLPAP